MADIKGVNVLGTIVPYTDADVYATHEAKYGKGGWRSVDTLADLDKILPDRLEEGMAVRVNQENTTYIWTKIGENPETHEPIMEWTPDSLKLRVIEGYTDVSTDGRRYDPSGNVIDASKGDYYIYIEANATHSEEYGRTGYVYDGQVYKALSGNVTAENVYFPSGVDRTEAWGRKTAQADVSKEEAKGKNLKDLIEFYILKEQFPSNVTSSYANDNAPSWDISYNGKPTEHEVYLDASYLSKATSGDWYTAGTKFYIPSITYNPKITASQETTDLNSGDVKTFSIGPSSISGISYGYWDVSTGSTYGSDDRIANNTVTFNDVSVSRVGGGTYRPKKTNHDAIVEYTYITGTSHLNFVESARFSDSIDVSTYSAEGDSSVDTSARVLTLDNSTGDASIRLRIKNGNKWTSAYTNNSIPKSDVIRISTNKNNPGIEDDSGSITYKDVSVAEKTVGTGATKSKYASYEECWTFIAKSAYPTYLWKCTHQGATLAESTFEWVPYPIARFAEKSSFNFATGDDSIFSKAHANFSNAWVAEESFKIRIPKMPFNQKPIAQTWANNVWNNVGDAPAEDLGRAVKVDVNDNAKQVDYYEYKFYYKNGMDALYKLKY